MTNDTKKVALAKVDQLTLCVFHSINDRLLFKAQRMSEFIAYPLEALNETYLNSSHANVICSTLVVAIVFLELILSFQLYITSDSHLANVISLLGHEVRKNIALFRRPVDKKQ